MPAVPALATLQRTALGLFWLMLVAGASGSANCRASEFQKQFYGTLERALDEAASGDAWPSELTSPLALSEDWREADQHAYGEPPVPASTDAAPKATSVAYTTSRSVAQRVPEYHPPTPANPELTWGVEFGPSWNAPADEIAIRDSKRFEREIHVLFPRHRDGVVRRVSSRSRRSLTGLPEWLGDVHQDYANFWGGSAPYYLGALIGTHAILANTSIDQDFQDYVQRRTGRPGSHRSVGHYVGEWRYVLAGTFSVVGTDLLLNRLLNRDMRYLRAVADYAATVNRAMLVAAPVSAVLQPAIGAARPVDLIEEPGSTGSRWNPYADGNGLSGHAFTGAIPFLVLAKRTDNRFLKAGLVVASTGTAISRITDNKHYLSQALLGYGLGYLAVEAVHQTNQSDKRYRLVALQIDRRPALGVEYRY